VADRAEAELLELAVQWAVMHPAETLDEAETFASRVHLAGADDQGVTLAGPGAPLVAEFSVAEFAAAVGMGTEAGKHYLGQAVELRYRLPRLWARVLSGELVAWKARRVADVTAGQGLTPEAAGFVDVHVAPVAHTIKPAALQRLVEEAVGRFMPETAEETRRKAADGRCFETDTEQVSFAGTGRVSGELDLADLLDLEDAVRHGAQELKDLGCGESLDVRRALAVGELARRQLALHLDSSASGDPETAGGFEARSARTSTSAARRPVRKTVLHLHLSEAALTGEDGVGRCENTRSPVTATQIRQWCGHPDTQLTVKPVIDLHDHVHVEAYEVPDRIAEHVALRDVTCVFPWCTRPARSLKPDGHGCDCDHVHPYDPGGPPGQTCTCRLAPLCRGHHRLKTHGRWTYTTLEPGSYLWTSPHGYQYLRDHTGTTDVSRH